MSTHRPVWLNEHPKDLIFKFDLELLDSEGQVWYRKIDSGFEIDYVEIPDQHRGKGFGAKLLKAFIEFCKTQTEKEILEITKSQDCLASSNPEKYFEIWLEVSAQNLAAIKTYKACGFKTLGSRAKYYPDGSDAILMSWVYEF